jgi:hypothetical protein
MIGFQFILIPHFGYDPHTNYFAEEKERFDVVSVVN